MGDYTNKLKGLNKGIDELIFLLTLSREKKNTLENLVKELSNYDNEIIQSREEIRKNDVDIAKIIDETTNCNQEFEKYMLKILELEGLINQLSYLDEFKLELEKVYDTLKYK